MSVETNSHNYTNMNLIFSQFVAAEFPKTPSPKPARIHSPDLFLRAGKFSRGFAKSFSPKNSFGKTESALKPHALPRNFLGRTPKEKHPFLFQKKFHPRQTKNARSVFSFGVAGVLASAWGFGSFVQFPLEKSSRKVYNYSTR